MAIMIATPPIVGVPRLALWLCGPSSRISWPKPCRAKNRIRYGVSRIETASATPAAMKTPSHATGSRSCTSASREPVQADGPRRLDQHDVAGLQLRAQQVERRRDVRDGAPAPVLGGADRHEVVHAQLGGGRRDLRMRGGGGVAQLGHPARARPRCAACCVAPRPEGRSERGQRLQGRAHRLRVRVVGVVDHGDAVRAVDDLHPPPRGGAGRRQRRGDAVRGGAAAPARPPPRTGRCRRGAPRPAAAPPPPSPAGRPAGTAGGPPRASGPRRARSRPATGRRSRRGPASASPWRRRPGRRR